MLSKDAFTGTSHKMEKMLIYISKKKYSQGWLERAVMETMSKGSLPPSLLPTLIPKG